MATFTASVIPSLVRLLVAPYPKPPLLYTVTIRPSSSDMITGSTTPLVADIIFVYLLTNLNEQ